MAKWPFLKILLYEPYTFHCISILWEVRTNITFVVHQKSRFFITFQTVKDKRWINSCRTSSEYSLCGWPFSFRSYGNDFGRFASKLSCWACVKCHSIRTTRNLQFYYLQQKLNYGFSMGSSSRLKTPRVSKCEDVRFNQKDRRERERRKGNETEANALAETEKSQTPYSRLQRRWFRVPVFQYTVVWIELWTRTFRRRRKTVSMQVHAVFPRRRKVRVHSSIQTTVH